MDDDEEFSPEETERRFTTALKAALRMPAKPHAEAKLGNQRRVKPDPVPRLSPDL